MRYYPTERTGKSGERLFETFIENELKFIYRKATAPDIGIDGEIETLDVVGSTTGGLIKVQIKTMKAKPERTRIRVAIDEPHLDYFSSLNSPPILALVSLDDNAIWWQPILPKEHYAGPRGGFGVSFDLNRDRLAKSSGPALRLVAEQSNAMIARTLLEAVAGSLDEMTDTVEGSNFDLLDADHWAYLIKDHERTMMDVTCLLKYERRQTKEIDSIVDLQDEVRMQILERKQWFNDFDADDLLREARWGDDDI